MSTKDVKKRGIGPTVEQMFGELHLRRYFAAAALSGLLARPEHYTPEEAARHAREAADEMKCQLEYGVSIAELKELREVEEEARTESQTA